MTDYSLIIIFFVLAILIVGLGLGAFWVLRKRGAKPHASPPQTDFAENELFLRISEEFKKRLGELIEAELQKNASQLKNELQGASEDIIKNYKSSFEDAGQEIQKLLGEFSQQISTEVSNLSGLSLESQNKIAEESKNKMSELNLAAEKAQDKLTKELGQKFSQIYKLSSETLNKKVEETEKEIDKHKQERFREMDRKIYQMIGEVAKKTIGKTIDLSDHEKLVMESLEKAKKEIF